MAKKTKASSKKSKEYYVAYSEGDIYGDVYLSTLKNAEEQAEELWRDRYDGDVIVAKVVPVKKLPGKAKNLPWEKLDG